MNNVRIVSKLPTNPDPNIVYYVRTTREILINTPSGPQKFQALYGAKDIDTFSVAKHYPLYSSESLAIANSPLGTATAYGEPELGPAPLGVSYPVYMPDGLVNAYTGDYIDPIGDDDGDGILNFRDPDIVGLVSLPTPNYTGADPFTTSGGVGINIKDFISNPDDGSLNDTGKSIAVNIPDSGLIIGPNGELQFFIGPGSTFLKPGYVLFKDKGSTGSPLPQPTPAYTSDPFITTGAQSINILDYLNEPDSGSLNDTGSTITLNTTNSGVLVGPNGELKFFLAGSVEIPDGFVLFRELDGSVSPLPSGGYSGEDPYTTSLGVNVNIKDYLENPDKGSKNTTGSDIEIVLTEKSILVLPDGTITSVGPGSVIIPPGGVIFSEVSTLVTKALQDGLIDPPPEGPDSISVQWFEENSHGDLQPRLTSFESQDPAIEYWEAINDTDYAPRESAFITTEENIQYFEDNNGDITPRINQI